jgi:restriction system protein
MNDLVMTIPDYQSIMLPLLQLMADQQEHSKPDAVEHLSKAFKLTQSERDELLPSGRQRLFDNRVGWARMYLAKAGLLESARRGHWKITQRGSDVLTENPPRIDVKYLERFPEFVVFKTQAREQPGVPVEEDLSYSKRTPRELIEDGYDRLRGELVQELLNRIMSCSPGFFETMVVELLVKMGYGGSQADAGKAIGRSGDEGVDGIIKEDKLGLDAIYIQAKRWQNPVGRPDIHRFVGALQGQRATKGIFITTSRFSDDAKQYASSIGTKVVLIDGEELARLMIDSDVGVSTEATYGIKRVDNDYFAEE